jgi:hypothetical protein
MCSDENGKETEQNYYPTSQTASAVKCRNKAWGQAAWTEIGYVMTVSLALLLTCLFCFCLTMSKNLRGNNSHRTAQLA